MPISDDGSSAAFQSENGCPLLARSSSYPESTTPPSPSQSLTKLDNKKSVRPFRTNDEYLYAMKEDLAAWFNDLYSTNLTAENLLDNLQDGVFLCRHANNVRSYIEAASNSTNVPNITYRSATQASSFHARDNVANFISWVRQHLHLNDVLLFESDDLVINKNEKNVVLCILEVARRGARYGMLAPMLVQFEQEIDALEQRIKRAESRRSSESSDLPTSDAESDKASLDEWVQQAIKRCTCPKQFPLINISRGKYRVGYTQNVVFVRILRNHVMIRVGGGWDTLEHYLDKHDPCRCRTSHNGTPKKIRQRSSTTNGLSVQPDKLNGSKEKSPSIADLEQSPIHSITKHTRTNSADLLCSDLVITRDDTGRHVVADDSPASPTRRKAGTSPTNQPNQIASNTLSPSGSPSHTMMKRSVSPSVDLMMRLKEAHRSQSPNSRSAEGRKSPYHNVKSSGYGQTHRSRTRRLSKQSNHSNCSSRDSSLDERTPRNLSRASDQEQRTRSSSRTPINERCDTPSESPSRARIHHTSPRKERRPSATARPTRIPAPVQHVMISSTSTCSSMSSTEGYRTV